MGGAWELGVRMGRGPGAELRGALDEVPGLRLDVHRGTLGSGRGQATVSIESLDCIGVRLDVNTPVPGFPQRELPGNLRFARTSRGLCLIADLHTDPTGLVQSFAEIDRGLRLATGRSVPKCSATLAAPDTAAVGAAVDALPWGREAVVQRDHGHEVRLPVGDAALPVRVVPTVTGLHVHRTVLDAFPEPDRIDRDLVEQAIGDQVHRLNAGFRWARLTRREVGITAETHLHTALISPRTLATACRAVAAVAHRSAALLDLLAQGEVARHYFDMFLQHSPGGESR